MCSEPQRTGPGEGLDHQGKRDEFGHAAFEDGERHAANAVTPVPAALDDQNLGRAQLLRPARTVGRLTPNNAARSFVAGSVPGLQDPPGCRV